VICICPVKYATGAIFGLVDAAVYFTDRIGETMFFSDKVFQCAKSNKTLKCNEGT